MLDEKFESEQGKANFSPDNVHDLVTLYRIWNCNVFKKLVKLVVVVDFFPENLGAVRDK